MESAATLSPCGRYRYNLTRVWDPILPMMVWIMLNPSTADAATDDPTIRKCIKFAKRWGFGGMVVVNIFAFRATDPKELKGLTRDEAIGPEGNTHLIRQLKPNLFIVTAWGQNGKLHQRGAEVSIILRALGIPRYALKLAKDGSPYHPLYMRDDTQPFLVP